MTAVQGQVEAAPAATAEVAPAVPAVQQPAKAPIAVGKHGLALTTFDEIYRFAKVLADSDLAPKSYKGNVANCFIAIQLGMELGISPMQAVQNIAPVNGKPSLYGEIGLALVEASGLMQDRDGFFEGKPYEDDFKYKFMTQRVGRKPYWTEFSVAQAKRAKLWGKQGPWTEYPDTMLTFRAIWPNLKTNFADVLKGMSGAEIMQDVIDITPEPPAAEAGHGPAAPDPLQQRIAAVKDAMHGSQDGDRPASDQVIEVTSGKPTPDGQGDVCEEVRDRRADRAKQFEFIAQLCAEIDALSPGASSGVLLALGGTTPQDDLTGEQIADIQQKLAEVRDQLVAKAGPAVEVEAEPKADEQPAAADVTQAETPAEDAAERAAAISKVNSLVDQIDQARDGAGGTALHDFLGTMDLDAVPLAKLLETVSQLTTTLTTVQKAAAKPATKDGKDAKADGPGQRSLPV